MGGLARAGTPAYAPTCTIALHELDDRLREGGVDLHFAGVEGPVHDMMLRSGLGERLGNERLWPTVHDAMSQL